jgi:hypothetical protein
MVAFTPELSSGLPARKVGPPAIKTTSAVGLVYLVFIVGIVA